MLSQILYVENNLTMFVCHKCWECFPIDITKDLKNKKSSINIKCSCGNITNCILEFRNFYRKEVEIAGTCIRSNIKDDIIIRDLSLTGCSFEFSYKSVNFIPIGLNTKATLQFNLGNTDILKNIYILRESDLSQKRKLYRCKFTDSNFNKSIGWFLKP